MYLRMIRQVKRMIFNAIYNINISRMYDANYAERRYEYKRVAKINR